MVVSASAYLTNGLVNATGDGTHVWIPFNATVFDIGSNFNLTNGSWVAPSDGIVLINGGIEIYNLSASHNMFEYLIYNQTTTEQRYCTVKNAYVDRNATGYYMETFSETMQCSQGDVFFLIASVYNGTKTVTITGGTRETRFNLTLLT